MMQSYSFWTYHWKHFEDIVFDFSSAFNTMQPTLLGEKLEYVGVDHNLTSRILNYLTNCPQYVRIWDSVSDTVICPKGGPQGTVLTLFPFTVYILRLRHLQKFCYIIFIVYTVSLFCTYYVFRILDYLTTK